METIYKGIAPGTEIVDKDGHGIGKVHEVICDAADQLQMVTVQRGLIFKTDIAVPAAAIDHVAGGTIYLSVARGDLAEMLKPTTLEPPPVGARQQTGLVMPRTAPREGDTQGDPVPEVQPGVIDPVLNAGEVLPDMLHDVDTGAQTHDWGIGTPGVPGEGAGPAPMTTGGAGPILPAQSEEPTSQNRT